MLIEPVLFLHLRKTAGTTFLSLLQREYDEANVLELNSSVGFLEQAVEQARQHIAGGTLPAVISGHFGNGIAKALGLPRASMVTFLREPIDRLVSQYFFFRGRSERSPYRQMELNALLEGAELPRWSAKGPPDAIYLFDNTMVRYLASSDGLPIAVPFGQVTSAMLSAATDSLRSMTAIGLTENFHQSVELIARRLQWKRVGPPYGHANRTTERSATKDLPSDTIRRLERWNELDIALYEFGKTLYASQFEQ